MSLMILKHPIIKEAESISTICSPLKKINITYFAHVKVDNDKNFSAIANNPIFCEIYLTNQYFNSDIHLAEKNLGNFVVWDAIELSGKSHKMHCDAFQCGVKHTFTIIEKKPNASHFYHFASDTDSKIINQVYLSNLDYLKQFICHFNEKISNTKELSKAHDLKFKIDQNISEYSLVDVNNLETETSDIFATHKDILVLNHKDTSNAFTLAPQQSKCLQLLVQGYSAKEIAVHLNLSYRTVNHYIERLRKILNCRTSKEVIAIYGPQVTAKSG